ncbi:formyl transferase [Aliiglaciecola litoralis]|uniref:Formyl transferase N-terminal domain-containing protein n=1 Tax=Aliiglaciecola litoralis TaxID=582857 RepID=A0ABP3X118_9ALTE
MRITVLANRDLASNIALNLLFKNAPQHTYTVLLSESVGRGENRPKPLQALKFFEQTLMDNIVFPLMDNNPHHDFKLHSFAGFQKLGIRTNNIKDVNNQSSLQTLAAHKPHLIVSIRFGQILQQPVIDLPEFGVLNLHSGKLPEYRGVMATFWAMAEGQQNMATTLHHIDSAQIDAGPVLSIAEQPIDYQRSYLSNVLSLYPAGVMQLIDAIDCIDTGSVPKTHSIDINQGKYYRFPDEEALHQFHQNGLSLVDYEEVVQIFKDYQ